MANNNSINNTSSILNVDNLQIDGNTLSSTDTNGNVIVDPNGTGTLVSDKGVSFDSGTNTLAAYETGTWTPTIQFGGASVGMTYSVQEGKYQRVGDIVFINFQVTLSAKGSSTGAAKLLGVPFPNTTVSPVYSKLLFSPTTLTITSGRDPFLDIGSGSSQFNIRANDTTTVYELDNTNFTNTSRVRTSGFYFVNS